MRISDWSSDVCSSDLLEFSIKHATAVMGVFGAFNYGLHLFGGYLGGRFLSNRNLFVGGMVLQVLGCGLISTGTTPAFYWGLDLVLTGSGQIGRAAGRGRVYKDG